MAFGRRRFTAVLLLFLLAVVSTAVPISRSLKTATDHVLSVGNFHSQDVKEADKDDWVSKLEGRMNVELADYPGTGANNNHDPGTPGTPGRF